MAKQIKESIDKDLIEQYDCLAKANTNRIFTDVESGMSVRSNYSRADYNYYNYNEQTPTNQKKAIKLCMSAYNKVGVIRNIIDLMSEFACQGIRLQHPNKSIERFYQKWFEKVNGVERSERFLNYLYRSANVAIQKKMGRVTIKKEKEWKAVANALENTKIENREIPVEYVFHNPLTIELVDENKAIVTGNREYALRVPNKFFPNFDIKNEGLIPLDKKTFSVFFYKRDDWMAWAYPITYSILDDLIQYEKLRLADIAALNGVISGVRLWRLGSLEYKIAPTAAGINKLKNILSKIGTGSSADVIWGPELDFKESTTNAHQFLGMAKYEPTLIAIYSGMGIPPALTGMTVGGKSTTNNIVSLKTLIERLEYGRSILLSFWKEELSIIQKAMGFRYPATITFDQMILGDETAEKSLLVQLIDRDIISVDTLLEKFDINADIEDIRVKRNVKERGIKKPDKAGPFHNPQKKDDIKKMLLENGYVTPSQIGIDLEEGKPGEKTLVEVINQQEKKYAPVGNTNDGRPKNSKDKKKRKNRVYKPTAAASFSLYKWATDAQETINGIINPAFLGVHKKKSIRELTTAQKQEIENAKYSILYSLEPFSNIDNETVYNILDKQPKLSDEIDNLVKSSISKYVKSFGNQPSIEDIRNIHSNIYSLIHGEK